MSVYLKDPDEMSIFGCTYNGVPNPQVPHEHPYPTRYHGPIWGWPDTRKLPYTTRPYAVPPFVGFGETAPLFAHVSGSGVGDALLGAAAGAAAGYLATSTQKRSGNAAVWGAAGAAGMYLAGLAGLIGVGIGFYWVEKKG